MRTICFILSSIQSIHSIKRIDEFVEQGYDVKVFGFNREDSPQTSYDRFDIEIIKVAGLLRRDSEDHSDGLTIRRFKRWYS